VVAKSRRADFEVGRFGRFQARLDGLAGRGFAGQGESGRVAGLIPMVYDNLNLAAQMPHQKESWGGYSEMIADYSKRGLPDIVSTPRGKTLAGIIDPWTYRERITMPTLIINGSNDSYWPLDAFNLYRGGLIAPTNVFYAPNSGHMLNGNETRVAGITAAWFKQVAQGKVPPQVLASTVDAAGKAVSAQRGEVLASRPGLKWRLQVLAPDGEAIVPRSAKLWAATSATRDFRGARWKSVDLGADREIALDDPRLKSDNPADFHAVFGEVELPGGVGEDADAASPLTIRVPFALSSPVTIWK
jgi:PhoPQ-activated pathogenicity-related protein